MSTKLTTDDVVRLRKDIVVTVEADGLLTTVTLVEGDVAIVATEAAGDHVLLNIFCMAESNSSGNITVQGAVPVDLQDVELLQPVDADAPGEPETKPPEPEEPKMSCETRRYSTAMMKATTKRPEVSLYQSALKAVGKYDGDLDDWYGNGSAKAARAFQQGNSLDDDGIIGGGTATELIKQAEAAGYKPELNSRIMSVITMYEVSNRADAYGMAENDIGDNAGANYGVFQCNNLGSVKSMLRLAGREDLVRVYNSADKDKVNPDIKDWFGSIDGIATQNKYFETKILRLGMNELRAFGRFDAWENDPAMQVYWGRAVLLFCDSIVQNGTMWSGSRKPFWKGIEDWEKPDPKGYKWPELYYGTWWNEQLGKYIQHGSDGTTGMKKLWWDHYAQHGGQDRSKLDKVACKAANQSAAQAMVDMVARANHNDPTAQLAVVAHIRSRSSWDKYWFQAVASRRITDAFGTSAAHPSGVVNGRKLDLACDYQL